METKELLQFEIITNSLVSSFCFIWISMLWVYGHYNLLILSVRASFTSIDGPRTERVENNLEKILRYNISYERSHHSGLVAKIRRQYVKEVSLTCQ